MILKHLLPMILPSTVKWVEAQALHATQNGVALQEPDIALARAVGVRHPELIRLLEVDDFPFPAEGLLRKAAMQTGLLAPGMLGITFGHSVLLRRGHSDVRLRSHEFRHVFQYEEAGSIEAFLVRYLHEIISFGYAEAPLELDAREHEINQV